MRILPFDCSFSRLFAALISIFHASEDSAKQTFMRTCNIRGQFHVDTKSCTSLIEFVCVFVCLFELFIPTVCLDLFGSFIGFHLLIVSVKICILSNSKWVGLLNFTKCVHSFFCNQKLLIRRTKKRSCAGMYICLSLGRSLSYRLLKWTEVWLPFLLYSYKIHTPYIIVHLYGYYTWCVHVCADRFSHENRRDQNKIEIRLQKMRKKKKK